MNKKAEKFKEMLSKTGMTGFTSEELNDEFHGVMYRSNLEVNGQYLPVLIILDDSIYTVMRVFVAAKVVPENRKEAVAAYLNQFNRKFKALKYYISDIGDIVLDCCIVANDDTFDPDVMRVVLMEVILRHLQETYADTMQHVKNEKADA